MKNKIAVGGFKNSTNVIHSMIFFFFFQMTSIARVKSTAKKMLNLRILNQRQKGVGGGLRNVRAFFIQRTIKD